MTTKINHEQTANNLKKFRLNSIAEHCGVARPVVTMVINGTHRGMDGPQAQRVVARLRELGVLAEVEDVHEPKLAA